MSSKSDPIKKVTNMFKMLGPEQRAILYSKIPNEQITDYLKRAWQKDMIYEAFQNLYNYGYIQLNNVYNVLDDILFREEVKVVAKLFNKLNQRQRDTLYETLTYNKDIRKILNKSVIDDNSFEAILYLSDKNAIDLEDMYNYLTTPPKSPVKVSAAPSKRKRSSNSNSPGQTRKRSRHPSPRGFSPIREIPMSQFGRVRPGNGSTKEEEASARKLFFPEGTQTNIRSFLKKPPINKRGTITKGRVTNNSNNED